MVFSIKLEKKNNGNPLNKKLSDVHYISIKERRKKRSGPGFHYFARWFSGLCCGTPNRKSCVLLGLWPGVYAVHISLCMCLE